MTDDHIQVDTLAEELFRLQLSTQPLYASQLGHAEYIGELPDPSDEGVARTRAKLMSVQERAGQVPPAALDPERRITHALLLRQTADQLLALEARAEDYTVATMASTGVGAVVLVGFAKAQLKTPDDAEAYLRRCAGVPDWLGLLTERLAAGAAAGRRPVGRLVRNLADQLAAQLEAPIADDPLVGVQEPPGTSSSWRDRLVGVVRDEVRPAIAGYRRHLLDQVAPESRDDDHPGIAHLPGGVELYQRLAAMHTTTDRSVEDIHRTGLDLVAELVEEMRELGGRTLGTADFTEITRRLREDESLRFTSAEDVLAAARTALTRAQEALPAWVGRLPEVACQVRPMSPYEAPNGLLGYYQWPSGDGARPGTYWVNTYKPETRFRFEAEALAFHESAPGHHTQLALSQELAEQSDFRRHARVTAFTEGWALYTERLADEMGLYTSDVSRLGMISFDFWRACRLVVDTGMHAMGWSRDRAVTYMYDHSALTPKNVENEIDRYISWPGQALGYMLGRLEIRRLRSMAESKLGPSAFDLRDFHAEILSHGALPLSVLAEVVERWADG
ncbi:DUF885 domain-containing protein [Nonomuraea sp. K274]|uniref:DUF885 domain-containing protein n=1 Tax=Nonomuraea cypriaca TaxID=1187855 RepID=A0A931AG73_9ACTN|nr:DUF885 domain-containing protein [Nonomuraea cypriaca]MBF8188612.1 DUF885 domain-containing protein [Nonomuraea cypriaca]